MKRRILLGWEFGAGNGHAVILREIARYFPPESYELRFAMRSPATGIRVGLDPHGLIQAPDAPQLPQNRKPMPRSTYGEFVCEALMGPGSDLDRRFEGWNRILATFTPDAIVAEYAPALSLLARGRVPVVATGSGYSLPPADMPEYPSLTKKPLPRFASEAELVDRLNRHLRKAGARNIDKLPQLNAADAHGLMTLPLFDPYTEYRHGACLGVSHPGGSPEPGGRAAGLIAYFNESWQVEDSFIHGLRDAGITGEVFLGPPLRRTTKRLAGSGITLARDLFNLSRHLPGKALAIHGGTLGFAAAAAFAGLPQLILPQNQENVIMARALQQAGAAVILTRAKISSAAIAENIRAAASDMALRPAAAKLAKDIAPYRNRNPAKEVANIGLRLAG